MPRLPSVRKLAQKIIDEIPIIYVAGFPVAPQRAGVAKGKFWWLDGDKLHCKPLDSAQVLYGGKALQWPEEPSVYVCPLDAADDVENAAGTATWAAGAKRFEEAEAKAWLEQGIGFL